MILNKMKNQRKAKIQKGKEEDEIMKKILMSQTTNQLRKEDDCQI